MSGPARNPATQQREPSGVSRRVMHEQHDRREPSGVSRRVYLQRTSPPTRGLTAHGSHRPPIRLTDGHASDRANRDRDPRAGSRIPNAETRTPIAKARRSAWRHVFKDYCLPEKSISCVYPAEDVAQNLQHTHRRPPASSILMSRIRRVPLASPVPIGATPGGRVEGRS